MNLLVVGAAEGQDVDEKMGRGVARERSGLLKWCGSLAKPHKRSHQPTRERTCRSATSVPHCISCRASDPAHRLTERAEGEPPMVQVDYQFASEKDVEISAERSSRLGRC